VAQGWGLFRDRNPALCPIDGRLELEPSKFFHALPEHAWESLVAGSPLYDRGWVFQERLLSPRTILFPHRQLFWECREKCVAEYDPYSARQDIEYFQLKSKFSLIIYTSPFYMADCTMWLLPFWAD